MEQKTSRWPCLVAGVVMMLFAGVIYAWSILKAPLEAEFGWAKAALGLNFTIMMCGFCLGGILGGIIIKRLSPRFTVILSGIVVFIGFCLSSRLQGNIVMLYIAYGGLCGLGIGVAYNVVISTVTRWFPDKRATASGALMMGFGASTLVLGSITGYLINAAGWRTTYFALGLAILIVLVIGSLFLRAPGPDVRLPAPKAAKGAAGESKEYSTPEMLSRASFWKFYIFTLLVSSIGTSVISFAKDVSLKTGAPETVAITLVGVLSVCNGLGRVITGWLFDTIGRRRTMLAANAIAIVSTVIMLLAVVAGSTPLVIVGLVCVGLTYGTMPPISSGFIGSVYGMKNFPLNFSIANTQLFPASFSSTIAGALIASSGNYTSTFIMLICFAVVALFINVTIKKA